MAAPTFNKPLRLVGAPVWRGPSAWVVFGVCPCAAALLVLGFSFVLGVIPHLPSTAFAAVDAVTHASLAMLCTYVLTGAGRSEPLFAAGLAAILIDLDHAISAGTIAPDAMMSLASRPVSHSIAGAIVVGVAVGLLRRKLTGFAAMVGVLSHLILDAAGVPGVPWLFPLSSYSLVLGASAAAASAALLALATALVMVLHDGYCRPT